MLPGFDEISTDRFAPHHSSVELGRSREGRPVTGYRFGHGRWKISLVAGCHADEPVGPALLERVTSFFASLPPDNTILRDYQWWIVPHINPDGAKRNRAWNDSVSDCYDIPAYLQYVVRELPGDDIEFGFPRGIGDRGARPENHAVYNWWISDPRPFDVHVSLHGMGFAGGPWFLIDPDWRDRCEAVKDRCRSATETLGYKLHDIQRHGEKGFERIEPGFCTRPNSEAMARYFIERENPEMAAKFRPSSMETIRSMGGDALTLVTEIPLFVLPGVGETIDPVDQVAENWRERIEDWKSRIAAGKSGVVRREIETSGVRSVPIADQMRLQWETILAGIGQVLHPGSGG